MIIRHSSAVEFLKESRDLLLKNEAEYSLMYGLTLIRTAPRDKIDDYIYLQIFNGQILEAVCVVTDKNALLTAMSENLLTELVNYLANQNIKVTGIVGPTETCKIFDELWRTKKNVQSTLAMSQKIFSLNKVVPVQGVPGHLLKAELHHTEIVGQWIYEFVNKSLPHEPISLEEVMKVAPLRIGKGDIYLWQLETGEIVSMNSVGRPTDNTITVSLVYTPQNQRKKGYASALVAATSQLMLDQGKKYCVLYTDVSNPTSNKIYQEVGYKQVATSLHFVFKS